MNRPFLQTLTAAALSLAFLICTAASAPHAHAQRVWKEYAFGLSLQLPAGLDQTWPTVRGNASFRGHGCEVYLYLQQLDLDKLRRASEDDPQPGSLSSLNDQIWVSLGFAGNERQIANEREQSIAGRPGIRSTLTLTKTADGTEKTVEQILFKIDRYIACCLWVVTPPDNRAAAETLAEEITQGLTLTPPDQIDAARTKRLEAGDRFISGFNRELLLLDLPYEQFYRVSHGDKEVGGLHYVQDLSDPARGRSIIVRRSGRTVSDTGTLDFDEEFSQSLDGQRELWQRRATDTGTVPVNGRAGVRPGAHPGARRSNPIVHADETGATANGQLAVSRQSRTRVHDPVWRLPPIAYLSQTDAHLLLRRLPRQDAEMAFYSYDTQTGQIKLMIVRVETQLGGRYTATIHRRPESSPELWTFDRSGNLLSQHLPNGNVITPCRPQDLKEIWAGYQGFN